MMTLSGFVHPKTPIHKLTNPNRSKPTVNQSPPVNFEGVELFGGLVGAGCLGLRCWTDEFPLGCELPIDLLKLLFVWSGDPKLLVLDRVILKGDLVAQDENV